MATPVYTHAAVTHWAATDAEKGYARVGPTITILPEAGNSPQCRKYRVTSPETRWSLRVSWFGGYRNTTYSIFAYWDDEPVGPMYSPFGWQGASPTSFRTLAQVSEFAQWWFEAMIGHDCTRVS